MSIYKRDIFHAIPFMLNFGIWLTPVFFTVQLYPVQFHWLVKLNPMYSSVSAWRVCLLNEGGIMYEWVISFFGMMILFILGMYLMYRNEDQIAEQ